MQTAESISRVLASRTTSEPWIDLAGSSIASKIGDTPLLRLRSVEGLLPSGVEVFAKAEYLNPGGSIKDRPAFAMVRAGLQSGSFVRGQTLVDATSGNTGIAYAMLGASLGFPVALALPANASAQRKEILQAFGADVILTDWLEGTDGARKFVLDLIASEPGKYFYPDQYNNDANWRAHYQSTGPEILRQTGGRITHFVSTLGTTGTFTGVARRLRSSVADIRCVGVQPDNPMHGIEGVKHLETAVTPGIYDSMLADEHVAVSTEESQEAAARLAREEGLLVGTSSGANVAAALRIGRQLDKAVIVTVLCDTGTRYMGERSDRLVA